MNIVVGMHQHQGGREYQQDSMSIKNFGDLGVLSILADGMGGYEGGEIASEIVSEKFREFVIEGEDIGASLKQALDHANHAIADYKKEHPEVGSMGTTVIACFINDRYCQWISVGDSPLYLIRERREMHRINANHSIAGLLELQVRRGEIGEEEARNNPQRHMLTSAVSGGAIPNIDLSDRFAVKNGDIFILASDGVETLDEASIKKIVLNHVPVINQENIQKATEALVNAVIAKGKPNQDNVTVIMLAKKGELEEPTLTLKKSNHSEREKKRFGRDKKTLIVGVIIAIIAIFLWFSSKEKVEKKEIPGQDANRTEVKVQPSPKHSSAAPSPVKKESETEKLEKPDKKKATAPAEINETDGGVEAGASKGTAGKKKSTAPKPQNKVGNMTIEMIDRNKTKQR